MTPKEKAKELFIKFREYAPVREAKQCALIAVDEILKEIDNYFLQQYDAVDRYYYYKEVKQEIELL